MCILRGDSFLFYEGGGDLVLWCLVYKLVGSRVMPPPFVGGGMSLRHGKDRALLYFYIWGICSIDLDI